MVTTPMLTLPHCIIYTRLMILFITDVSTHYRGKPVHHLKDFFPEAFQTVINNEWGRILCGGEIFLYLPLKCLPEMGHPDVLPGLFTLAFLSLSGTRNKNLILEEACLNLPPMSAFAIYLPRNLSNTLHFFGTHGPYLSFQAFLLDILSLLPSAHLWCPKVYIHLPLFSCGLCCLACLTLPFLLRQRPAAWFFRSMVYSYCNRSTSQSVLSTRVLGEKSPGGQDQRHIVQLL